MAKDVIPPCLPVQYIGGSTLETPTKLPHLQWPGTSGPQEIRSINNATLKPKDAPWLFYPSVSREKRNITLVISLYVGGDVIVSMPMLCIGNNLLKWQLVQ